MLIQARLQSEPMLRGKRIDTSTIPNEALSPREWEHFELCRLASIRRFLTSTATATLVSAFVLSRIDYCNSLLFGSTHGSTHVACTSGRCNRQSKFTLLHFTIFH